MQVRKLHKSQRIRLFNSWFLDLIPPCRTCRPRLVQCSCSEEFCNCDSEVEIDVVDSAGDPCECEWPPEEAIRYLGLLGDALAMLDPAHYATPPEPMEPIITASSAYRVVNMQERLASGFHLYHPDDLRPDFGRVGETSLIAGNGAKMRSGIGCIEESSHEARYSRDSNIRVHKCHSA